MNIKHNDKLVVYFIAVSVFRMLNEQLDKTMKEASELRLNNARLASQVNITYFAIQYH